ncbi:hypothetical protein [Deinococcus radiophilus]|uniref:Uncharacterized protein n=1 Tax=Deinococcus radiophilus TaxID=32062 RepID=A0A431VTZ5_9DEIO|nr:hypothetical protein [Deinococcus radiophilus]RTR26680.1 hypothetical protein EJ104_07880 [Deinococcus radiophilus]UFA50990.1 hypothetical protein LMT64_03575 [Deinococcus radiophilus]
MTDHSDSAEHLVLTASAWQDWLDSLCDLPDGPAALSPEDRPKEAQPLDAYGLSAYAEALLSAEVDGELWDTYGDLELEGAQDEESAWREIKAFYADRGYALVTVQGTEEPEEWILAPELVSRLKLREFTQGR